ncbi:flagellar hook-associated protein FlgL [Gephyromycinifex aptenodytis]|uniref:flagellar hook-associated protein FlgL n=1 Tax=Gephyromycinifex aptenodytis TaxID=2716227 RepID=UPI00144784BE|nr:flagellar hook-associated protein FlgL [Gephyromycinifex aptenodytis]
MSLRITQNSMNRTQLAGLNTSLNRLQQTQEQLTTGKRLNRPSDDPVGTVSALRFRSEQSQLAQFGANITDGLSRLQASDDALSQTSNMTQRIRTQALAALNGTGSQTQMKAYAAEIREMRAGLLQQANSQYAGQPLFGGTTPKDNAFDPATGAFQGNNLPVLRQITDSPGDAGQINVGVNGQAAFGNALVKGTGDLDKLAAAIEAGDSAGINAGLAAVDKLQDDILNVQATVGTRVGRLVSLEALNGRQDDASRIALSKVEDTDFLKAAMDLSIQSNAYQAALSASAKIIQPSLMDFIR